MRGYLELLRVQLGLTNETRWLGQHFAAEPRGVVMSPRIGLD
jgi:hypothetical protein